MAESASFEVYRAEPTGVPRGGLILIHEIWGLVPHIRGIADRLAAEGYLVLTPDLLSDAGLTPEIGAELSELMHHPDDAVRTAAQPRLREATAPSRSPDFSTHATTRLRGLVDELDAEPGVNGRIGVLGFCFGGTYSFALAAADSRVRVAVPFYGTAPAEPETIAKIASPVLALYGAQDQRLMDALPGVEAAMTAAHVDFHVHVYPDAGHAFFNDTNPLTYRPAVAADAWERTLEFLAANLGAHT